MTALPTAGPAASPTAGTTVFVADYSGDAIVAHTDSAAPSRLPVGDAPMAVAADGDAVYYTTWGSPLGNGAVHRMPRGGGPAAALETGLRCPVGIAVGDRAVYAITYYGMLHVYPHDGAPYTLDLSAEFDSPNGIVVHGGTLYAADWMAGAIRTVDLATVDGPDARPSVRTLVRPSDGLTHPGHLAIGDGALYVTQTGSARGADGSVERIDLRAASPRPRRLVGGLAFPTGIALDGGTLYVSEVDAHAVAAVALDMPVPVPAITALDTPWGLAV